MSPATRSFPRLYRVHVLLVPAAMAGLFAVGAPLAYALTQRLCLGLTRRERDEAEHGRGTGQIVMSPDGGFSEITEPVPRALEDSLDKP